jgi:uncharacterized membrane protein YphA (DoxX/SURF4 family)
MLWETDSREERMLDRMGGGFKDYAPFGLRLGLAVILIIYGADLVQTIGRFPTLARVVALVVTLLGGLFCLIGFLTRWAAFSVLVWVIFVILDGPGVHAFTRLDSQLWLGLLSMSFALFGLGGGKWSVDASNRKKKEE